MQWKFISDTGKPKMHRWGDEDFDWNSLNDAIGYFQTNCRRWGRLGVHVKEKWGTMRVSTTVAFVSDWPIHSLVKPGHAFYRWPRWLIRWVEHPLYRLLKVSCLLRVIQWYQLQVLRIVWLKTAAKWPHIATEILDEYKWETK